MVSSPSESRPLSHRARRAWWALAGSLVLHGILFIVLGWTPKPTVELPIRLPLELEIGLGESEDTELGGAADVEGKRSDVKNEQGKDDVTKVVAPTPVQPEVSAPTPTPTETAVSDVEPVVDAGAAEPTAQNGDAAVTDAGAAQLAGSGTADAGPVGPRRGMGGGEGSGFGVDGALLALRIDVANVRKSALILETEALLSIVPGWQRMFAGSGLVPLQHFRRFVIATPNLHPSRLSMAATLREGLHGIDQLKRRGSSAEPLRDLDGMPVGTWSARGSTRRDIVLLDPSTFAISRAQDLPRLLSLARVLGAQVEDAARNPDPLLAGLLHMGKTEALSLSVHHVAAFVPEPTAAVPASLSFVLKDPTQLAVQLYVTGHYESDNDAEQALSRWRKVYEDFAARPDVMSLGLVGAIEHASFERRDSDVIARTELTMFQLRYLLGQLRDLLQALVPQRAE